MIQESCIEIEVEQGEYIKVSRWHTVNSGGLGPCTGVFIYSPKKHEAYAGHFVDTRMDGLEKMVKEAIKDFKTPSLLKVYVGGGSLSKDFDMPYGFIETPDDEKDIIKSWLASRAYAEKVLKKSGFKKENTSIRWSPDDSTTVMRMDPITGEVDLRITYGLSNKIIYEGPFLELRYKKK